MFERIRQLRTEASPLGERVDEEWPALVPLVQSGRLRPERYISHVLPLNEGAAAYAAFDSRSAGALKMVLIP